MQHYIEPTAKMYLSFHTLVLSHAERDNIHIFITSPQEVDNRTLINVWDKPILRAETIPLDHRLDIRTTPKLQGLKKKVLLRLSTDCKLILFRSNKK